MDHQHRILRGLREWYANHPWATDGRVLSAITTGRGMLWLSCPRLPPEPSHEEIKSKLLDLGRFYGLIAEAEVQLDGQRFDVVWRKTERANPCNVFEVQRRWVLEEALTKLKHASDLWNASPGLVVTNPEEERKAMSLLRGAFHEIAPKTVLLKPKEVFELWEYKKHFREIEEKMMRG